MADKTIGSLPAATTVDDSSLWVAENQGQAQKVTGAQIKGFARESVQQYASQAQQAAEEAQEAVTQIGTAVDDTEANAQAAQAAQTSAESARDEAIEASQGVSEYVTQAKQAASQATQSASDAQISASTAETYSDSAEIAKTAAETAKSSAETARDSAEAASAAAAGYSSTAQTSASQASQSAQTAQSAQSAAETAKTGAESARQAIENMMVEAITLATGQPATVSKTLVDQVVKLTFGLPTGAKGDPGDKGDTGTGIQSIELTSGTHAPGTTDTYTITLSDDSTFQFTVYNGANGTGAGDFMADGSVPMTGNLDMNGNRVTEVGPPTADTDAANKGYVDEAVSNMEITTDTTPTQGSTNPVQSGGVYTALSKKQDTITGQQGQVVGFDASGKPVAQAAPDTGVTSFNGRKGAVSPGADDYSADMIKFTDGQTFQDKYDSGQLTGPAGANGAPGATGLQGEPGQNATINGVTALTIQSGTTVSVNLSGGVATFEFDGDAADVPFTPGSTGMTATDVQAAITELFTSVSDGKSAISAAITDKGVETAADATFQQLADNIAQIQTGTDTSDATATARDILRGKTAYGATGKLTGTIPSQNATTITPGTSAKTAIPAGTYAAGKATVAGDANLVAGNIKRGVSIFGVAGSYSGAIMATLELSADETVEEIDTIVYFSKGEGTNGLWEASAGSSITVQVPLNSLVVVENWYLNSSSISGCTSITAYDHIGIYRITSQQASMTFHAS